MDTHRNHAENLAHTYQLRPQAVGESNAEYREWVARELNRMKLYVESQEALFNEKMSGDPFAYMPDLSRGFGDASIGQVARAIQGAYEAEQEAKKRAEQWKRLRQRVRILFFGKNSASQE